MRGLMLSFSGDVEPTSDEDTTPDNEATPPLTQVTPPVDPVPIPAELRVNRATFVKTSMSKKQHYRQFPTLSDYAKKKSIKDPKVEQLTQSILAEKPSGNLSDKGTLLHILNGAAKMNGKSAFFDSSKGIRPELTQNAYLNAMDGNDSTAAKFVLTLKTLNQLVDDDEKYELTEKLIELKESISSERPDAVLQNIKAKLGSAHGVDANRILITDVYLNGVGVAYTVKDLTDSEKQKIITKSSALEAKMKKLFDDYDRCAIHPALLEDSYDIAMFDELGNKTFGANPQKFKVGPPGKEKEYTQPAGWTRYGLKVLGKCSDDKWLTPFQDPGNWYRSYHGTTREAGSKIYNGAFKVGTRNAYGKGVYCSPDINTAASYCKGHGGTIKMETKNGTKEFYFVFQVAVNPATMNNPAYVQGFKANCPHYIAPSGADIRPYGILIKEV